MSDLNTEFKPGDVLVEDGNHQEFVGDYKQVFIYEPEVNEKYPWREDQDRIPAEIKNNLIYRLSERLCGDEHGRYAHEGDILDRYLNGDLIRQQ